MEVYFITGVSRGIGAALAKALLGSDRIVYGFSRGDNPELRKMAKERGYRLRYHQVDLSLPEAVQDLFSATFEELDATTMNRVCFIHNAGLLEPIRAIGKGSTRQQRKQLMQVNVLTPMLINELLIQQIQDWPVQKQILHISSGAGKRPTHAWSAYCASKAALDMYTECLALEQSHESYPIATLALAPGVVETAMQETIRSKSEEEFRLVERFHRIKESGTFFTTAFVAESIIDLINSDAFGQAVVQDLRHIVGKDQK